MMEKENYQEDETLFQTEERSLPKLGVGELAIAELAGFSENGAPLIRFQFDEKTEFEALTTVAITPGMLGRQVAVMLVVGTQQPMIVGVIKNALDTVLESTDIDDSLDTDLGDITKTSTVDGKKVVIEGEEEIVLKCGDSSITLTKAGKILIRGKYLLNRSSGVNRIMGGSVQVN